MGLAGMTLTLKLWQVMLLAVLGGGPLVALAWSETRVMHWKFKVETLVRDLANTVAVRNRLIDSNNEHHVTIHEYIDRVEALTRQVESMAEAQKNGASIASKYAWRARTWKAES